MSAVSDALCRGTSVSKRSFNVTSRHLRVTNRRPHIAADFTSGFESPHSAGMSERLKVPALPRFVIATAFGVSSTMQAYSMRLSRGRPVVAGADLQLLTLNLVYWYVPALLAPLIIRLALRYQIGRGQWHAALVHVAGALAYSILHTAAMLAPVRC